MSIFILSNTRQTIFYMAYTSQFLVICLLSHLRLEKKNLQFSGNTLVVAAPIKMGINSLFRQNQNNLSTS